MWVLVLMTCAGLNCEHIEVRNSYRTLSECEAAMNAAYKEIKEGQAIMCYRKKQEVIET